MSTVAERLYVEAWWKARSVEEAEAILKRERKAAKREEDSRRSAEGRERAKPWRRRPMGLWDWWEQDLRLWSLAKEPVPPAPRWRQRLNHRRSLPWVGPGWLASSQARGAFAARMRRSR